MSQSIWLYVDVPTERIKVFASYDTAIEWLRENDPEGAAVEYPIEEELRSCPSEAMCNNLSVLS